ncbi:MAG: hypothetical protein NZ874_10255, partial [Fimbriimonadales bacterium]|nr:hypothetical protein [Fimbriimonadales bacterium]
PEWWHGTYAWAGSFVTYLLEQFGLPRFRRFYCRLAEQPVDAAFQAEFGTSIGQAELLWREYLHKQLPAEMRLKALRSALRDILAWTIHDGQYLPVQLAAERLRDEDADHWLGYYGLAYYAFWQGDLERAREHFEQAAHAPKQEQSNLRGLAWFQHGLVCDLLGQRARACECYQRALEYPDGEGTKAYHARARKYLETPYTYEERYQFLREA